MVTPGYFSVLCDIRFAWTQYSICKKKHKTKVTKLSSKHPLVGQFKRLKCEQRQFFFLLQKWHWFAAFVDPLWLIATIEYIALCHYLWFNDDSYPVWLIATIEYIALVTRGSQEKSRISSLSLSVVEQ